MKRTFPTSVLLIVALAVSPVAAKSNEGCKLQGSWQGFSPDGGRWLATYHGQSPSAGTNDLEFFMDPKVYCFHCGEPFTSSETSLCPKCGWMKCPKCGVCRCDLDDDVAEAVFHMRKVYEDLVIGRVKPD